MLASWSHEGVIFLDFLPSPHLVTSFLFPYLGSTDALFSRLGDLVPLPPRWHPYSQGPRTLPYRDPAQLWFWGVILKNRHALTLISLAKVRKRPCIFWRLNTLKLMKLRNLLKIGYSTKSLLTSCFYIILCRK